MPHLAVLDNPVVMFDQIIRDPIGLLLGRATDLGCQRAAPDADLFAIVIGWALFGERMDRGKAVAAGLIVAGVVLTRL